MSVATTNLKYLVRGGNSLLKVSCGQMQISLSPRGLTTTGALSARKWKYHADRDLKPPPTTENTNMPDKPRLPIVQKTPSLWLSGAMRPPRGTKEMWRMMGEEKVHCDLNLGQYGIVALTGGMMKSKNFDVMRLGIGKHINENKGSFAIYRVDPPYKAITNHGFGKRMGGGKGSIDGYGTPVRAGRIILEVGGKIIWDEVRPWLDRMAKTLPFPAMAINAEMIRKFREEEARLHQTNKNPISFEWLVRNNIMNCQQYLSEYDQRWFGKFVYKDRVNNKKWQWVTRSKYRGKN